MLKNPAVIIGTILVAGNQVSVNWAEGTPQNKKVEMLNNLAFAEHEILIRHKYFNQSNILDPHTQKQVLIPKEQGAPN